MSTLHFRFSPSTKKRSSTNSLFANRMSRGERRILLGIWSSGGLWCTIFRPTYPCYVSSFVFYPFATPPNLLAVQLGFFAFASCMPGLFSRPTNFLIHHHHSHRPPAHPLAWSTVSRPFPSTCIGDLSEILTKDSSTRSSCCKEQIMDDGGCRPRPMTWTLQ